MKTAKQIEGLLRCLGDKTIASHSQGFFKTGRGEYGEGDIFLGIRVPDVRAQVKKLSPLDLDTALLLLKSKYHEVRLFALLAMVRLYERGSETLKTSVCKAYLRNTAHIDNWDLVDISAYKIVGTHLETRSRSVLYRLAKSQSLWERRIAIISTFHFIRRGDFEDALAVSKLLLKDSEDLIHKAVGWMLREIGKRDRTAEEHFLRQHYRQMPRTMLRYAIERFPETLRQKYLKGRI